MDKSFGSAGSAFRLIRAEWLKYRRTAVPWLLVLAPVVTVILAGRYTYSHRFGQEAWIQVMDITNQIWSAIWLPLGVGLIAGLSAHLEAPGRTWRALRGRNVSPAWLYVTKLAVLGIQTLLSTLWLVVLILLTGVVIFKIPYAVPWLPLLTAMVVNWFVSLPLLFASYWIAEAIGWAVSIGLGFFAILVAAIIGGTGKGAGVWAFVPWSWPIRMVYQVYGLFMPVSSTPSSSLVFWGVLTASAVLTLTLTWGGSMWFERQEVG